MRSRRRLAKILRGLVGPIELALQPASQPCFIHADPGELERVLMNLAANARDAMPNGGSMTMSLDAVELDDSLGGPRPASASGPFVRLSVKDTGCGMTPEVQAHLFTPLFTTKGKGGGTGLGLATVRDIVERAGGFIAVDTVSGQGTTFAVYLPRMAVPEPLPKYAAGPESAR